MSDTDIAARNPASTKRESQKKRVAIFVSCSLFALLVCASIVFSIAFSLITEGVYEFPSDIPASLTPMPAEGEETVECLRSMLARARDDSEVYLNVYTDIRADSGSLEYSGDKSERAILEYMMGTLISEVDSMFPENYEGSFEDGFDAYPTLNLSADEYSSAVCTQGRTGDDGELEQEDFYFITVTVPVASYPVEPGSGTYSAFNMDGGGETARALCRRLSPVLTVTQSAVVPGEFTVDAKLDRLNDRLVSIAYTQRFSVALTFAFAGDLASLGTRRIAFDCEIKETYDYTWAGISFAEDEVRVSKGESRALTPNAVMNDYGECEISFASSDESVAEVDALGYVTGVRDSVAPAEITVTFKYLGKEYRDVCRVYVGVPVEKIEISDDELYLTAGASVRISASVAPRGATNRDIIWISEDESVAVAEDMGGGEAVITARGEGSAVVIAVSDDGHFRDSCVVRVKGR